MTKNTSELTLREKIDSVVNVCDAIAKQYASDFYCDDVDNRYIDMFLMRLNGESILDAGCGVGEDCKYVEQKGYKAVGIDFSEGMLDEAKSRYSAGNFKKMDMSNIEYPDNTFDGIMCNYSLFHIPIEQLPQVLSEFKRVLKPNGQLLLILQEGAGEMMIEEPYIPGVMEYINYFSVDSISKLLKEHEFDISDFESEQTTSEFELGEAKLVVFASNKKHSKQRSLINHKGEQHFMINDNIPKSVLEYGFDFDWDEEDVWNLDYPSQLIDIEELSWHFDIPFWDFGKDTYNLTPNQVINDKDKYKEHYDRIINSNINYPIDIMENKGRYVILDGLHRLVKYKILGHKEVMVRIIPREEIPNISK